MTLRCLQLVPTLPPPVEGVGSYALALAEALEGQGVSSHFLVGDPAWRADPPGAAAEVVSERSARALRRQLAELLPGEGSVLLHYVGYGYAPRGCPFWLVDGLLDFVRERRDVRLVTLFHEVAASGPPWRSSFWLSPAMRYLAARLARGSHGLQTSLARYARLLEGYAPGRSVTLAPVFSTVGEPAWVRPLAERAPRLVLFGGRGARTRALFDQGKELQAVCEALEIEEIVEIGPPLPALPATPLRSLGELPAREVSAELQAARVGLLAYPPDYLGKSTIFAAYAAHGLLPVCLGRQGGGEPRPPFWLPGDSSAPGALQSLADAARSWYSSHTLPRQARELATLLSGGQAPR